MKTPGTRAGALALWRSRFDRCASLTFQARIFIPRRMVNLPQIRHMHRASQQQPLSNVNVSVPNGTVQPHPPSLFLCFNGIKLATFTATQNNDCKQTRNGGREHLTTAYKANRLYKSSVQHGSSIDSAVLRRSTGQLLPQILESVTI